MEFYDVGVYQSEYVLKVVVADKCIAETIETRKHIPNLAVCFYQLFESTARIGRDLLITMRHTSCVKACNSP
jgi:hypothetical protein